MEQAAFNDVYSYSDSYVCREFEGLNFTNNSFD